MPVYVMPAIPTKFRGQKTLKRKAKNTMLKDTLQLTLSDFAPVKGRTLMLAGEQNPYRVSDRLYTALHEVATRRGQSVSHVFRELRDELNANSEQKNNV